MIVSRSACRERGRAGLSETAFSLTHKGVKAGFNPAQIRDVLGRWSVVNGVEITTSEGFYTGIQSINDTSAALSNLLANVMSVIDYLPGMSPQTYGVAVHAAFGVAVSLSDLPGVGDIERSFHSEDSDPRYGLSGSIRTDLTLRNIQGDIVAI